MKEIRSVYEGKPYMKDECKVSRHFLLNVAYEMGFDYALPSTVPAVQSPRKPH
jgi:hypothetical protein